MPEEFGRTTKRKRVSLPGSQGFVDIPVITEISFIDPVEKYQETVYTINNTAEADRKVHVDEVPADGTSPGSPFDKLKVERIEEWKVKDPVDRGQETFIAMDNVTTDGNTPPSFITHLKTHVVRYTNPEQPSLWIESELIDEFIVKDPIDRGQETYYVLNNPLTDEEAQADPEDELVEGGEDIDPPWRTDPFQNIINWNGPPGVTISWFFRLHATATAPVPSDFCDPAGFFVPNSDPYTGALAGAAFVTAELEAPVRSPPDHLLPPGFVVSGQPSSSGNVGLNLVNGVSLGGNGVGVNHAGNVVDYPPSQDTSGSFSSTFNLYDNPLHGPFGGCYANEGGGPAGVTAAGAVTTETGTAGSFSIDANGISATLNGNPMTIGGVSMTASSVGLGVPFSGGVVVTINFAP